jgi:tetratricopeptide (TPR) repeat protein
LAILAGVAWLGIQLAAWLGIHSPSYAQVLQKEGPAQKTCSKPESLQSLDLSTAQEERSAAEHYARALELQSRGNGEGAEKEFQAALAERPMKEKYVRGLTLFYIARSRYEEAVKVIRDYVKLCGVTPLGYELEGELLFKGKQYDLAYEAARQSLALSGNNARMHELLGLIYIVRRQEGAAVLELEKAAEQDPDNPEMRYYCGRALYSAGRVSEGRDQFLVCLKIRPDFPKANENLGLCYEGLGETTKAIAAYRKEMEVDKAHGSAKNAEPYAFYGRLLLDHDQPEEAASVLRQGVTVNPNSFAANYELGRALFQLGTLQEAEHYLVTAKNLDPKYARTYYVLGRLHQKQNKSGEATRDFEIFQQLRKQGEDRGFPLPNR